MPKRIRRRRLGRERQPREQFARRELSRVRRGAVLGVRRVPAIVLPLVAMLAPATLERIERVPQDAREVCGAVVAPMSVLFRVASRDLRPFGRGICVPMSMSVTVT